MTRVFLQTSLGRIVLELSDDAPVTSANFLRYVDEDRYRGASFYRTVRPDNQPHSPIKIEVIQGGLGMDDHPAKLPPIPLETTAQTGLRHLHGTVSMSRLGADTAHSEIFICVGAQPELDFGGRRHPDGQGFAAFAWVAEGMAVVLEIQAQPSGGDEPPVQGQMILEPVRIERVSRL
jgi:peptidyl-prolyl cis-trans isomerase A (cyclophilin A)